MTRRPSPDAHLGTHLGTHPTTLHHAEALVGLGLMPWRCALAQIASGPNHHLLPHAMELSETHRTRVILVDVLKRTPDQERFDVVCPLWVVYVALLVSLRMHVMYVMGRRRGPAGEPAGTCAS